MCLSLFPQAHILDLVVPDFAMKPFKDFKNWMPRMTNEMRSAWCGRHAGHSESLERILRSSDPTRWFLTCSSLEVSQVSIERKCLSKKLTETVAPVSSMNHTSWQPQSCGAFVVFKSMSPCNHGWGTVDGQRFGKSWEVKERFVEMEFISEKIKLDGVYILKFGNIWARSRPKIPSTVESKGNFLTLWRTSVEIVISFERVKFAGCLYPTTSPEP